MTLSTDFQILQEQSQHQRAIEDLHETVFGPGRFARTAFRVREGCDLEKDLSFVAMKGKTLCGSVRLTKIVIGEREAYLLGPLCVRKSDQNLGMGRALITHVLSCVRKNLDLPVILVGDHPYYGPLGFDIAPAFIKMPGPVDHSRLLIAWPQKNYDKSDYQGLIRGISTPSPTR